jgi:hypothetical protein
MSDHVHWYYLHVNGDLIHRRFRPDPSDFVRKIWRVDIRNRAEAWQLCIEALALGANRQRVDELATKWGLTDADGQTFVERSGGTLGIFKDGDAWCAHFSDFVDVQKSQVGFGSTVLDALAELARPGLTGQGSEGATR